MLEVMRLREFVSHKKLNDLLLDAVTVHGSDLFNDDGTYNYNIINSHYSKDVWELLLQVDCHELFIFTSLDECDEADPTGDQIEIVLDEFSTIKSSLIYEHTCEFHWEEDQLESFVADEKEIMLQICHKYGLIEDEVKFYNDVVMLDNYELYEYGRKMRITLNIFKKERDFDEEIYENGVKKGYWVNPDDFW